MIPMKSPISATREIESTAFKDALTSIRSTFKYDIILFANALAGTLLNTKTAMRTMMVNNEKFKNSQIIDLRVLNHIVLTDE